MSKKTYFITQLENGQTLEGELFGLATIKRANDRNGKPYLDLELVDKTGSIKAKVWSDSLSKIDKSVLTEGTVINVNGLVGEFNGNAQLTVYSISKTEEFDLSDFLQSTKHEIDELWEQVEDRVDDIADAELKKLLEKLLQTYEEEMRKSPAARGIHHNYVGGLLEHVVEMLKMSDSVVELYPEADPSLVTAGIIMHDIGKIKELRIDGFQITYSKVGKLIGHIPLGLEILNNLDAKMLSEEIRLQLAHIILSHHFILEFGSPVTPKTIEAMIVSKLDDLSSKVRIVQRVLESNQDNKNEFSAREFSIDSEVYLGNRDI